MNTRLFVNYWDYKMTKIVDLSNGSVTLRQYIPYEEFIELEDVLYRDAGIIGEGSIKEQYKQSPTRAGYELMSHLEHSVLLLTKRVKALEATLTQTS